MDQRQIRIEGTDGEQYDAITHGRVKVDQRVNKLRSFLIQFFFAYHAAEDRENLDKVIDPDFGYIFHCSECRQHTQYYRRPSNTFQPKLCLSTTCLTKQVDAQV